MKYSGEEKRRHPRILLQARAILHASERQLECLACNLSESGALILPPAKARAGLAMRVNIGIPGLPEWISANAVLVRETEFQGRYAWGVRFTQMTPHAGSMLRSYIRQTLRGETTLQMSAAAQPLVATDDESSPGRDAQAMSTTQGRQLGTTGPHAPVASATGRGGLSRVPSGSYARVGEAVGRTTRASGAHGSAAPTPEPASQADPGKSGDDYTDPFADLPTSGSRLKDVAETSSGEFVQPDGVEEDWESAHANVNLNKLYQAALEDVSPKVEKKKGWFSR